jgi:hypothetical protein
MKSGRLVVLVLVAFMAVAGLVWQMNENAKDVRMLEDAIEQMKEVRERDYGKDER